LIIRIQNSDIFRILPKTLHAWLHAMGLGAKGLTAKRGNSEDYVYPMRNALQILRRRVFMAQYSNFTPKFVKVYMPNTISNVV